MSKSDARSSSIANESVPNSTDMRFILSATRVYEELGSRKDIAALVDNPPKLLLENEADVRLHAPTEKKRTCKIYVFDKYFIVASLRTKKKRRTSATQGGTSSGFTDSSSSDQQVVWFGDKKTASNSGEATSVNESASGSTENEHLQPAGAVGAEEYESDSDSEVDLEQEAIDEFDRMEAEKKKKHRKYNLKMWIDLRKVKARCKEAGGLYGILITYVTKVQEEIAPGEFRFDTSVDMAEVWLENGAMAKTVLGIIQEAVNKNAQEVLENNMFSKNSVYNSNKKTNGTRTSTRSGETATDSETDSTHSSGSRLGNSNNLRKTDSRADRNSSSTSSSASTVKKRRKFVRAKEALQATSAFIASSDMKFGEDGSADHAGVITMKDIQKRYKDFVPKVADVDEGLEAEYSVMFKNPKLGFALSSSKKIGPFVCRLVDNGLAEASGVALGDRVISINETEVPVTMQWQDCVKLIKAASDTKQPMTITFIRKQKNEIDRQKREEEQAKMNELAKEEEEMATATETDGTVEPVEDVTDSPHMVGKKQTLMKTIELRRKTDDGSSVPKFTIKRKKTGKRRFAKKHDVLKNMKYQITNMKELAEFRKNKTKMFDLFGNIDSLFETVIGYLTSPQEKTCIFSLKEIYDTEYKYNSELNMLREFHVKLLTSYKNIKCRDLKTGRPFCEHRRPLRFCSQKSSTRENAVDRKEVDSIFLNLKPIMKSNVYLWKNLQNKLGELYETLKEQKRVEVQDILGVFCSCFAEIAPFLQIYWEYCKRYTSACEKQKTLRATNEHFREIVTPIEKKHKMKLPNLLSKPVQRITRYHLLFTTLTDYVRKYVKDEEKKGADASKKVVFDNMLSQLQQACSQLTGLAQKVNMKVGEAENLDQMVEIYSEIGGKEGIADLLQPYRRFVSRHVVGFESVSTDEREDEAVLYLFNDMFVVAVPRSKRSPSAIFGNGSKLSFPLRKLKNLSVGTTRNTSIGKNTKKLSLMSGSNDASSKRKSVRAAPKTPKQVNSKGSADSKESKKEEYYEVVIFFPFRTVGRVTKRSKKGGEEGELFGFDLYCSRKGTDETELFQLVFWHDTEEAREKLHAQVEDLREQDKNKRAQLEAAREKHGGGKKKKKARKFKKKHENFKKASEQTKKDKAKSSILSSA